MGKLDSIMFSEPKRQEFDIEGHKVVLKEASSGDNLEMKADFESMGDNAENVNVKTMLANLIEILSYTIVSIDGIEPENVEDTRSFLLKQKPKLIFDLFAKQSTLTEDIKEINEQAKN